MDKLSTILFVDDESEIRAELKKFLQRYANIVILACNGKEGLEIFKKNSPDIVISDINMPVMNGIDMIKEIKKISPEQATIFTTAYSDNGYFLEAINMQVDGYMLKPVDLKLLEKKIISISKDIMIKKEIKLQDSILNDIAQMQGNMIAVYDKNNLPIFYNTKLLTFLGYMSLKEFIEENKSLSRKFEISDGCYYPKNTIDIRWIEEIKKIDSDKQIVSMLGAGMPEVNFFLVSLSDRTVNNHIIVTFSEITKIFKKKSQYKHNSYTDELTQIDNRARFNILFDEAIQESKKDESPMSIVLMDIDNFKQVNDRHGHMIGDSVLKMLSSLILANTRSADSFSRWGGEEFVLLLPDTSLLSAKNVAENLRLLIQRYDFGINEELTCSFGVTTRYDNDTSESIFERVDRALYRAKHSGRNNVKTLEYSDI